MTLRPGDLLATGTPAGVGYARTPPQLLHPGDSVEVEVTGPGVLRNSIVSNEHRRLPKAMVAAPPGQLPAEKSPPVDAVDPVSARPS